MEIVLLIAYGLMKLKRSIETKGVRMLFALLSIVVLVSACLSFPMYQEVYATEVEGLELPSELINLCDINIEEFNIDHLTIRTSNPGEQSFNLTIVNATSNIETWMDGDVFVMEINGRIDLLVIKTSDESCENTVDLVLENYRIGLELRWNYSEGPDETQIRVGVIAPVYQLLSSFF